MKIFRKALISFLFSLILVLPASAAGILPSFDEADFKNLANDFGGSNEALILAAYENSQSAGCKKLIDVALSTYGEDEAKVYIGKNENEFTETFLACGISSGNMSFWMIPYYIRYTLSFLIGIAGLLSVLMILVGAYYYIAGGISDDKEKGKTIIKFAIGGLILTSLAWILVNFLLLLITA